jgi:hypothetical protein
MFSFLLDALVVALLTGNLGGSGFWLKPVRPEMPDDRHYNVTENLGVIDGDSWFRPRQIGQPLRVTPVRTHGGIGP